jgi:aminopeptidase-like protein
MRVRDLEPALNLAAEGRAMHEFIAEAYPICRSITGDGVRRTLRLVQQRVPLGTVDVPSGTQVYDWTVPREWNIRDAYIADAQGRRIVDFRDSNLHVVSYSVPVRARLTLAELRPHLFTLPLQPTLIPYRTAYYTETWGFCLRHEQLLALREGEYEVCIDSSLEPGHLTYGEYHLPGAREEEVLLSCHVCHPSLCNDNLSGLAVATFLAEAVSRAERTYSYRFLFIPGTIGSITWLARNEAKASRIRHGLVLTGVGDSGGVTYKRSRRGTATIDQAAAHILRHAGGNHTILDFSPYGYDERQYCSPGFNLPVGCLMRSPHGTYPEYHTSADDLGFVRPESLADSLATCLRILAVLEDDAVLRNRNPHCEPQLGRRGLYRALGGHADLERAQLAMLWVLNLSDGDHSLLDIAERASLPFGLIREAANLLAAHHLLEPVAGWGR